MKISNEETNLLIKKLDDFLKNDCHHCKAREWLLNDRVFDLKEFIDPSSTSETNAVFPVAILTCKNCGTAHFFSAVLLGILPKKQ